MRKDHNNKNKNFKNIAEHAPYFKRKRHI